MRCLPGAAPVRAAAVLVLVASLFGAVLPLAAGDAAGTAVAFAQLPPPPPPPGAPPNATAIPQVTAAPLATPAPLAPGSTPAAVAPISTPAAVAPQGTPGAAPAAAAPQAPAALPTVTVTPTAVVLSSVCSNRPPPGSVGGGPAPVPAAVPYGMPEPIMPFGPLPLIGALPGLPFVGFPPAPMPPAGPVTGTSGAPPGSPVLSCVNTTSGVALAWAPYRTSSGTVTYSVFQCDRTATPGQPGCTQIFTTDTPSLVGPVSLGYDYLVQAQAPSNVIVVSNRVSL